MAFPRQNDSARGQASDTRELAIKGWTNSKVANTQDQGVSNLLDFLGRKASRKILSHRMAGRHVLIITINEVDKDRFYHLNGFTWAGANLVVEDSRSQPNRPPTQPNSQINNTNSRAYNPQPRSTFGNQPSHQNGYGPSQGHRPGGGPRGGGNINTNDPRKPRGTPDDPVTTELEHLIISVIHRRYHAGDKHLILNKLVADPDILNSELVNADASKVYRAIFALCERKVWETDSKRDEAVQSVSLRENNLATVQDIISLASTFPSLRNLDLADNILEDMGALKFWKNRFRDLEHLILTGNPVASKPDTLSTLLRWYPKLKMYNNEPIINGSIASQPNPQMPQAAPGPTAPANPAPGTFFPADPQPTPSPQPVPGPIHPEIPAGSLFGQPSAEKPNEVLVKEQMGLQFSFATKLKLAFVENCLAANGWDYDRAMANFAELNGGGQIPADAFLVGV